MRTALLLLKNYYDSYFCFGGKSNEHYFLAELTTVQFLHSSHQSLYIYIYVRVLKIKRVHVVMKVVQCQNHSSVTHISAIYN